METHETELQPVTTASSSSNIVPGLVLVGIGLAIFLGNWFDLGAYFLPLLGSVFILWGIIARASGPLIPGGILSGLSLGIALTSQMGQQPGDERTGGVFLLAFAAGWLSITLMSIAVTRERLWWPLIPSGIMALIGGALLLGGVWLSLLSVVGTFWPLGLIAFGLFLLWRQRPAHA